MSKSKFAIGDKVICIAEDGYIRGRFPIGAVFTIEHISSPGNPNECLSFKEVIGGPYSRKFELVPEEPTKMDAKEYEDIIAGQEIYEKLA